MATDAGKPLVSLEPVRWAARCGRCGATVEDCQVVPAADAAEYISGWMRDHDRLYHAVSRPDGGAGREVHVTVTAQASSWAGGWNEPPVDDSEPAS